MLKSSVEIEPSKFVAVRFFESNKSGKFEVKERGQKLYTVIEEEFIGDASISK